MTASGASNPTVRDVLLSVKDLEVQFATTPRPVRAVRGVSYEILRGETVALVGESGSGKTVSSLALVRLTPSSSRITGGSVNFQGQDVLTLSDAELRKIRGGHIGMVFQDPLSSLNPVLSIGMQITEGIRVHLSLRRGAATTHAEQLLQRVGIPEPRRFLRLYPHQLSGGMRQRVMIAIALSCNPNLVIADEPTSALDVTVQAQVLDLLRRLSRELDMAALFITHDLAVAGVLADRILVMYAGRIVEEGPASRLLSSPGHPYTLGLLQSRPSIDSSRGAKLTPIPGTPPDLSSDIIGCAFAPRCTYRIPRCAIERPPLVEVRSGQAAACWVAPVTPLDPRTGP